MNRYVLALSSFLTVVAAGAAEAVTAPFDLFRSTDAATVASSLAVDTQTLSPHLDPDGTLADGVDRFYLVRDAVGAALTVRLSKDRANGCARIAFDDGTATPAPFDRTFRVNAISAGDQRSPAVDQASDGGSVMIWQGLDADGAGIFGRVFAADGSPVTGEFVVNTTTAGDQTAPDVAVAPDRRFVVVWQSADGDGTGIYLQRFAADGTPVGGEELVNTTTAGAQHDAGVLVAQDASAVVFWQGPDADGEGILARLYDPAGQPLSGELLVNTDEAGDQEMPAGAMAADGRFVVAWQSHDGSDQGVYAQLFTATGARLGAESKANTFPTSQQEIPRVAMSDNGAYTVVWEGQDAGGNGISARAFDANGFALTVDETVVNTDEQGTQELPDVAMAADGSSLVVWRDNDDKEIRARRFDPFGAPLGGEFPISDPGAVKPSGPVVSLAGDGSSYIVLYEASDGNGAGIFAMWVPLS